MEALCRPDDVHWCVECCTGDRRDCPLFGDLGDGTLGCLGHDKPFEGIPQSGNCKSLDCLGSMPDSKRNHIRDIISKLPPGEFRMGKVLALF